MHVEEMHMMQVRFQKRLRTVEDSNKVSRLDVRRTRKPIKNDTDSLVDEADEPLCDC